MSAQVFEACLSMPELAERAGSQAALAPWTAWLP